MPSTPATLALHYNKKLFREAGLDPERPPRTIAELNEYAKKLTKFDDKGNLTQLGFSPLEPGWWNELWPRWFGGELWDGKARITADSPECLAAFEWIQSYPKSIGVDRIQRFTNLGGNFQSSQNLFIAGKVGMELQGVWMNLFISQYNPSLEWAAAPFPSVREDMKDVTLTECDVVAIPRGARHPDEAWEFVKFLQRQDNMEELNLMQQKFSPLAKVSEDFYRRHPNPYAIIFRKLAESPNARASIRTQVYDELVDEIGPAIDLIWRMEDTPANALRRVTERMQPKLDRAMREWERVEARRLEEWERINAQEAGQ
jgi:ABC-type glycerol-3-phosphate transport system substrate-binding protein